MRNYKKEAKWAKEKYERIDAKIDKDLGRELKNVLKQNDTSISTWITESAIVYLNVKRKERMDKYYEDLINKIEEIVKDKYNIEEVKIRFNKETGIFKCTIKKGEKIYKIGVAKESIRDVNYVLRGIGSIIEGK